jgi:TrwC relaxase
LSDGGHISKSPQRRILTPSLLAPAGSRARSAGCYVEDEAIRVRRGHAGAEVQPGDGVVAAAYRHRMSRSLDPQLHTHVVCANIARGPDGRWTALDARAIYAEKQPVRSALRRGDVSIATVMREQPAGLADRTLFEILLMAHQFGRQRLGTLNARAVDEHVNLAVTLDVAGYEAREWVARNALPHGRTAPRGMWAQLMED